MTRYLEPMARARGFAALLAVGVTVAGAAAHADEKAICIDSAEAAQKLRGQGKLLDARARLLECTRDACPKVVRDDCTNWISEVDKETPSVIVRARSPRDEDVDGAIAIDGKVVKAHVDGAPIPLDPGPHAIRLTARDGAFDDAETKVIVALGEKNRIVTLALASKGQGPVVANPPIDAPRTSGTRWVGWTMGGLGVASLTTFAVLQILAQGAYSDMKDSACGKSSTCSADVLDPIRTKFVVSGVMLGVGSALVVGSVIWLIADRPAKSTTSAVRFGIAPTAGGLAFGADGVF